MLNCSHGLEKHIDPPIPWLLFSFGLKVHLRRAVVVLVTDRTQRTVKAIQYRGLLVVLNCWCDNFFKLPIIALFFSMSELMDLSGNSVKKIHTILLYYIYLLHTPKAQVDIFKYKFNSLWHKGLRLANRCNLEAGTSTCWSFLLEIWLRSSDRIIVYRKS